MRFISPHLNYSIVVFEGQEVREADPRTGQAYTRTVQTALIADFEQGGLFPHEVETALRVFDGDFRGLPEGVAPQNRISVYDTEVEAIARGWTDEFHDSVVARLQALQPSRPGAYIQIDDKKQPRPWPKYDEQTEEEILGFQEALGVDPNLILAYEGENLARVDLLEKLTDLAANADATVVMVGA